MMAETSGASGDRSAGDDRFSTSNREKIQVIAAWRIGQAATIAA